jgi:hypothetical protein
MKDIDKDHFQFVYHNVNGIRMGVGMLEFVKYRTIVVKNQVSHISKCFEMFHKHKMKKTMNSYLAGVLHQMNETIQFYPIASWVVSFHNVGMDYQRS